jgi:hypothetical protein
MKAGVTDGGVVCLPGKTKGFVVCKAIYTLLRRTNLVKQN